MGPWGFPPCQTRAPPRRNLASYLARSGNATGAAGADGVALAMRTGSGPGSAKPDRPDTATLRRARANGLLPAALLRATLVVAAFGAGSATIGPWSLFPTAAAQSSGAVTRGPYLQLGTPRSVVVRWRTDVDTDSRVIFGSASGAMSRSAASAVPTREHEVILQGLTPATRYRYAVGTSTQILAGGGGDFAFTTSPTTGSAQATRIWVLGDSGTASSGARAVRDAFASFSAGRLPGLWLMVGDNAYSSGSDSDYQSGLFDMYPETLRST